MTKSAKTNVPEKPKAWSDIVKNGSWQPKNKDIHATVLQSSEDKVVFNKVIALIREATESICLQSFLIQDSEIIETLVEATKKGVRVFITSSAEARLKPTIEEEQDFIKEDYKKMLERKFKSQFVHRSAENLHAKFIVIDGKSNPKGMIFTNNFTKNGFFKNPELAVVLTSEQAYELFKVFVHVFWERTTEEQTADNEFESVKPIGQFPLPILEYVLLSFDNSLKKAISKTVEKAKKEIILSTFSIDSTFDMCKIIAQKQKENVQFTIFTRNNERQLQNHVKGFFDNQALVLLHKTTHSKFILIDNTEGYIFTSNFNQSDFEKGFNVGLKLSEQQTRELSKIITSWKLDMPFKWV